MIDEILDLRQREAALYEAFCQMSRDHPDFAEVRRLLMQTQRMLHRRMATLPLDQHAALWAAIKDAQPAEEEH